MEILKITSQMIQDTDKTCGGFVWEWCDHAIASQELLRMERLYMLMGDMAAKKFMMATSAWMD